MATCPDCEYDEIDTEDIEEGDKLSCPECGSNLKLVGADELDFADADDALADDDEEEDDDDDDDVEEEDDDDDDVDDDETEEEDLDE